MANQRLGDDIGLAADALRIQPRAWPAHFNRRGLEPDAGERTGAGGISDAHFARDKAVGIGRERTRDGGTTRVERGFELVGRHRRRFQKVGRAGRNLVLHYGRMHAGVAGYADIDHFKRSVNLARQHRNRRAACGEVGNHLHGDFLREG